MNVEAGSSPVKPGNEVSVVTRMYDLTLWLVQRTAGFSRAHRHTLGSRIESCALEVLELLVEASYTRDRDDLLQSANRRLERLRYLVRLAHDLKLLSLAQYEFAGNGLHAVGTQVGAWRKALPAP